MVTEGLAAGIAYQESNPPGAAGPPLLLVHGAGGSRVHWPEGLRALPGRRVIAVDLPGHGRSPPPGERSVAAYARRVLALLDALEVPAAAVAGHSMGGAVALTLGLTAPARVAGLVLVGTGARLRVAPAVLEATVDPAALARAAQAMVENSFAPGASAALVAPFVERLRATAPGVAHDDFAACDAFDVMARLGELAVPALVVCGEEDRLTPPKYAEFLHARLRGSRLLRLPAAGHMVAIEAAGPVVEAVGAFLRELAAAPVSG